MPDDLTTIYAAQNAEIDRLVGVFEKKLAPIIAKAQANVSAYLATKLTLTDGIIDRNTANFKILRNVDARWMKALNAAGYDNLIHSFTAEFAGQIPFLQDVLAFLSKELETPLKLDFTATDLRAFSIFRLGTETSLHSVMQAAAALTVQKAMLSLGGMKFDDLIETFATQFSTTIPKATTLADTSMATFYRMASDRAFVQIEKDAPFPIRYHYFGPLDKKTRSFCRHLLAMNREWTRKEIDDMDNGNLPNVFISCGGWACRHIWGISTRNLSKTAAPAAA